MLYENDFEDIICTYPELIEDGLVLKGRQLTLYNRRIDILFEDKFKNKLIIELKVGPIKDTHIGQILSYEGMLLSADDPTIRVMLVGNRVPPNIQKTLDHHGIAWKEIPFSKLKEFVKEKNDITFLRLFENEDPSKTKRITERNIVSPEQIHNNILKSPSVAAADLITKMKNSDIYKSFRRILHQKIKNESEAKTILEDTSGGITEHLRKILDLCR